MMRFLIVGLLGVLAGAWEAAVFPFLPGWLGIAPLLTGSVILLATSSRAKALVFALCGAALLSGYGIAFFDIPLFRYAILVLVLDMLARQFFTNRSMYATSALLFAGRCIDWFLLFLQSRLGMAFSPELYPWSPPANWLSVLAWDQILGVSVFFILATWTRRFSVQIGKEHSFFWKS